MTTFTTRSTPVKTYTRFDSAQTTPLHSHTFGLGVSPIDWDALAEDAADMNAICEGRVYTRNDFGVAAEIDVEAIKAAAGVVADPTGIPASVKRIRFVSYGSTTPCVRGRVGWVEEESGRDRMTFDRADCLYLEGRVAILADAPKAVAPIPAATKPAPKVAPKWSSFNAWHAAHKRSVRAAARKAAQKPVPTAPTQAWSLSRTFDPAEVSDDFYSLNKLRSNRRQLAHA